MEKQVIYKTLSGYAITPESNYYAYIQNARKVNNFTGANNPDEIIEYYCKYFGSKPDEFIIISE